MDYSPSTRLVDLAPELIGELVELAGISSLKTGFLKSNLPKSLTRLHLRSNRHITPHSLAVIPSPIIDISLAANNLKHRLDRFCSVLEIGHMCGPTYY